MSSVAQRLDSAIENLQGQGLAPVTIVLTDADHDALAQVGGWPVTVSSRGDLRFRGAPVFRARQGEGGSIVGRAPNGSTRRITFAVLSAHPK
jgi:hypothetical protein